MVIGYPDDPGKKVQGMGVRWTWCPGSRRSSALHGALPQGQQTPNLGEVLDTPPGKGAWTQSSWKRPGDVHRGRTGAVALWEGLTEDIRKSAGSASPCDPRPGPAAAPSPPGGALAHRGWSFILASGSHPEEEEVRDHMRPFHRQPDRVLLAPQAFYHRKTVLSRGK